MRALVIFESSMEHPLAWLLHRDYQHVWCCVEDVREGVSVWVSYNWRDGRPLVRYEAWGKTNVAEHYRGQEWVTEVLEIEVKGGRRLEPVILNNCVGMTKLILGIRSWALTPWQLRNYLLRQEARSDPEPDPSGLRKQCPGTPGTFSPTASSD